MRVRNRYSSGYLSIPLMTFGTSTGSILGIFCNVKSSASSSEEFAESASSPNFTDEVVDFRLVSRFCNNAIVIAESTLIAVLRLWTMRDSSSAVLDLCLFFQRRQYRWMFYRNHADIKIITYFSEIYNGVKMRVSAVFMPRKFRNVRPKTPWRARRSRWRSAKCVDGIWHSSTIFQIWWLMRFWWVLNQKTLQNNNKLAIIWKFCK